MSSLENSKLPLSVAIISFNEEENLARTLDAIVDIASEIVVVDSHSTDNTKKIAEKYNVKFYTEDWKGHIAQKNSALEKCSFPWVLSLDCDEVVTDELKGMIIGAIQNPRADGYLINRKTYYLGKKLNYAWQPDWNLRLVRKSSNPRWGGLDPHDFLSIDGQTEKLKGDLLHYSFKSIKHHFNKMIDYAEISSSSYIKAGRKYTFVNLLVNPVIAFVKLYFIHLGFLDGFRGLMAATGSAFGTFLKYAMVAEKTKYKSKE